MQVKKETQQLREFEEVLVSQYKFYLEDLEQTIKGRLPWQQLTAALSSGRSCFSSPCSDWKQKKKKRSQAVALESYSGLAEVAIRCLCELLLALSHFNFHNNIIVALAPLMNDANLKVPIRGCASLTATGVCCNALRCGFCVRRCRPCAATPSRSSSSRTKWAWPLLRPCESFRASSRV